MYTVCQRVAPSASERPRNARRVGVQVEAGQRGEHRHEHERRAERQAVTLARQEQLPAEVIRYLNRLSDALFVWSRWASKTSGVGEVIWEPNLAASARDENLSSRDAPNGLQCSKLQKER